MLFIMPLILDSLMSFKTVLEALTREHIEESLRDRLLEHWQDDKESE